MNMPNVSIARALDVACQALEIALEHFEEIEIDGEMLDPYDVLRMVGDVRDSLPAMPEPYASPSPAWARSHVFNAYGSGLWTDQDYLNLNRGFNSGWEPVVPGTNAEYSGYQLPIGIDWRTTLRRRPEVIA